MTKIAYADNDLAQEIRVYRRNLTWPSPSVTHRWHKEFLEQGLDHQMNYSTYLKQKVKEWKHQQAKKKKLRKQA